MAYRPIVLPLSGRAAEPDYSYDASPATIRDPRFQREYREMRKRQGEAAADRWTEQELLRDFYRHQTWRNNNTVSMATDLYESATADEAQKQRMARVQKVWEQAPTRGIDDATAWGDYAGSLIVDPLNLLGGAGGARAAWKAVNAGKGAGRVAWEGAKGGAKSEFLAGTAIGGVHSGLTQSRDINLGLQDEFSNVELLGDAAIEGGFGYLLGGAIGGGVAAAMTPSMRRTSQALVGKTINTPAGPRTLTESDVAAMPQSYARKLAAQIGATGPEDAIDPNVNDAARVEAEAERERERAHEAAAPGEEGFDFAFIERHLQQKRQAWDQLVRDGAEPAAVRRAKQEVVQLGLLRQIADIERNYNENTAKLAGSDRADIAAVARKNIAHVEELRALYRRLKADESVIPEAQAAVARASAQLELDFNAPAQTESGVTKSDAPAAKTDAPKTEAAPAPAAAPSSISGSGTATQPKQADFDYGPSSFNPNPELVVDGGTQPELQLRETQAVRPPDVEGDELQLTDEQRADRVFADPFPAEGLDLNKSQIVTPRDDYATGEISVEGLGAARVAVENAVATEEGRFALPSGTTGAAVEALTRAGVAIRESDLTISGPDVRTFLELGAEGFARRKGVSAPAKAGATGQDAAASARALEAVEDIRYDLRDVQGHPQYSEAFEIAARERYGADADTVIAAFRAGHANNGLPFEVANTVARMAAKRQPMSDQLRDFFGSLVRDTAAARGATPAEADAAAAKKVAEHDERKKLASENAAKTPTEMEKPEYHQRSATGRAADTLATGPETGQKPQAIFRSGKATERDPITGEVIRTITDGEVPTKGKISREEAELSAEQARSIQMWKARGDQRDVVGAPSHTFTTKRGRTKVIRGFVPHGTAIFYSPFTKRWYATEALALRASGRDPSTAKVNASMDQAKVDAGLAPEPDTPEADVPGTDPVSPVEGVADDLFRRLKAGEITLDEFASLMRQGAKVADVASGDPARVARASVTTPEAPAGKRVAVRHLKNSFDVRVLSDKQIAEGKGVDALIGARGNPADFEIGFVDEDAKSKSNAARESFTPMTPEQLAKDAAERAIEDTTPTGMFPSELMDTELELSRLTEDELAYLNDGARATVKPGSFRPATAADTIPLGYLEGIRTTLEGAPWPRSRAHLRAHIDLLAGINELVAKYIPGGVRKPVATREQAVAAIERIFDGHDPVEVQAAKDFLNRLSGTSRPDIITQGDPRFVDDPLGNNLFYSFEPDDGLSNRVSIDKAPIQALPKLATLYHEVAHWAYFNILTDADRAEFWRSMSKYYDEDTGALDRAAIDPHTLADAPGTETNARTSPQEFFANQFVGFVMNQRGNPLQDAGFWARIWRYVENVFQRFFAKDFIDPALEPLFAKILPDLDEEVEFTAIQAPDGPLRKEQSKFIVSNLNHLNQLQDELGRALAGDHVETALAAAEDLGRKLYLLAAPNNTFAPFGGYGFTMRRLALEIGRALRKQVDEDAVNSFEGGDWDDNVADAADIWLAEAEGTSAIVSPEAAFDRLRSMWEDGFTRVDGTQVGPDQSINGVLYAIKTKLNRAFNRNEGRFLLPPKLPDSVMKPPKGIEEAREARAKKRRRVAQAESSAAAAEASAIDRAKTPPAKRAEAAKPSAASAAATAVTRDARARSTADLLRNYAKADEAGQNAIAAELLRRQKAEPDPGFAKKAVPTPRDVIEARTPDLQAMLMRALDEGDGPRAEQVMFESWRRGENKRRKTAGKQPVRPVVLNSLVRGAIEREAAQVIGDVGDGIPTGSNSFTREALSFMSHRDPEVQTTMRTLLYRVLNLTNKTVRTALANSNIMTVGDIYRLAGQEQPANAAGAFADFRDPAFNHLRGSLRRMAIGLTKDVSSPFDVMHEVHHLALRSGLFSPDDLAFIRKQFVEALEGGEKIAHSRLAHYAPGKDVADLDANDLDHLAEEWFAESGALYSMGKVAKGDMFAIRDGRKMRALSAKSRLVVLANQLAEAVAYFVNGLLGRKTMKQMFRRIDGYGDMFSRRRMDTTPLARNGGVAPELAAGHYGQVLRSMSGERLGRILEYVNGGASLQPDGSIKVYYHGTPNGDYLSAPDAIMMPGGGMEGRGIYLSENPHVVDATYARHPTPAAQAKRIAKLVQDGTIEADDADEVQWLVKTLSSVREDMKMARRGIAAATNEADTVQFKRQLERLTVEQDEMVEQLYQLGYTEVPLVLGTVVRARNPFDVGQYVPADSPTIHAVLRELERRGTPTHLVEPLIDVVEYNLSRHPDNRPGVPLMDLLQDVLKDRDAVNEVLGAAGFDAIRSQTVNSGADGRQVVHNILVLIDHTDPATGKKVSASTMLKSIDASEFDHEDPRIYNSLVAQTPAPNAAIINAASNGINLDAAMSSKLMAHLDAAGAPPSLVGTMTAMARGRLPGPKEYGNLKKFFTASFGATSSRLEQHGMKTLADFHKMHYVEHTNLVAQRIYKLRDLLDKLPDSTGSFKRWLDNTKFWKSPDQPQSHTRIVNALRFGEGTPEFNRLSPLEQQVARGIRGLLDQELSTLKRAGVVLGSIKNYFPQVWNTEALARDRDGFTSKLANYFQAEARRDGGELDRSKAEGRAHAVWDSLLKNDGQHTPAPVQAGSSRTPTSDHLTYQRLIRLDDPELRANLNELKDYLENDLEGILVKYFDGSTRSTLHHQRWGVMAHGYYDYLQVADQGADGIAYLLTHNRVARKDLKSVTDDGYAVTIELRDETPMPFRGDEAGARAAANEVIEIYNRDGAAAAKAYLMALDVSNQDPFAKTDPDAPTVSTYEHRVNAIVQALGDTAGRPHTIPADEILFAQDAHKLALKKQIASGPMNTPFVRDLSRGIRTFNAVTMLSYAMLTSLPDLVMPMIRSGSFKAQFKALAHFASRDPVYARQIRNTGVRIETITNQRMAGLFGAEISGKLGRINNAFFNASMLTPWTDMARTNAAAVGFEAFKADVERAINLQVGDGSDIAAQPAEYRRIMRRLGKYGLSDYVARGQMIDESTLDEQPLALAVVQFANEAVFSPTPNDMPLWTHTPVGAIMWQLKSFPTMMMRAAKDIVWDDLAEFKKTGDFAYFKRPAMFLTIGPAMGAAAMAAKDIVQTRGGEDQREAALRNRNFAKAMGYDEKVHGDVDTFGGWYFEGMLAMGGFGLVSDVLHSSVQNAENGAFGQTRFLGTIFGPTVGTVASTTPILGAVIDSKEDSNSKERAGWREIYRRIPFVGGNAAAREALVDWTAGARDQDDSGGEANDGFVEDEPVEEYEEEA